MSLYNIGGREAEETTAGGRHWFSFLLPKASTNAATIFLRAVGSIPPDAVVGAIRPAKRPWNKGEHRVVVYPNEEAILQVQKEHEQHSRARREDNFSKWLR